MPRVVRPWFRFYVEAVGDRKLLRLTPAGRWLWVAILAAARESPEPGVLLIAEGEPMTVAELAKYADVPEREVRRGLATMEQLKMVTTGTPITVPNFTHRQFLSDTSTPRTRGYRERSKEHVRNVPTPFDGTPKEHVRNGPDARATETETETDTELRSARPAELEPERNPEVAGTAQTLIAEWLEHVPGPRPPERVIGQVAKELGAMQREGQPYADVRAGLQAWQERGLHPSALASVVHELRTAGPRPVRRAAGDIDWTAAAARAAAADAASDQSPFIQGELEQ